MSDELGTRNGNGTAIGVAAIAAGVVGTLASSLFPKRETRRERARKQVEQRLEVLEANTNQALDHLVKAVDGLHIQHPAGSRRAQRKARHLGKAAAHAAEQAAKSTKSRIADLDREAVRLQSIEKANKLGNDGSRRARELAQALTDRTTDVMADHRGLLPEWRKRTSRSASGAVGKGSALVHQALDAAPDLRDNVSAKTAGAASKGADIAHQAADRAPDVLDKVAKSLGDVAHQGSKVAAQVRGGAPDIVDKASKTAHDVIDQARDRAPEVRERAHDFATDASRRAQKLAHETRKHAPDVGAQVATALHTAQDQAKPILSDAASLAGRIVEGAKETGSHAGGSLIPDMQHRADAVAGKLAHASDAIEQQSKAAATAAGRGTKDGGAFVMWSAAAAGIIYYAFLDEDQRRKAKESGQRIVAEIREVYRDIRGYDEEFK